MDAGHHRAVLSKKLPYLALDRTGKAEALTAAAATTGQAPQVLEKDFWVCWCLERLFTATDIPALVFKGGTSLSKVFGAIDRFSEDVDITVSGADLGFEDRPDFSNSLRDKKLEDLKGRLLDLARGKLRQILEDPAVEVSVDDDSIVWVRYDSHGARPGGAYFRDAVKIELGARSPLIPSESHAITADLAAALPQLVFPTATVQVLSPVRTFWEKATILHAEYYREASKPTADRMARHYYDLSQLADHEIGSQALRDISMLETVAADKARLFRSKWARYDLAKPGSLRLVPPPARSKDLATDLSRMIETAMFSGHAPTWTRIVERLAKLEDTINSSG